ncbi:uncharacterized protein ARMOST_06126 [Armillaria ostoyae]|uniref:Uncharacterized protein n=1 Tax=Armillaria ostoyae TaxID=47428 RepID=A0A284R251_ARMOS|nr:uncharacterized protein ARMOST_06126 [Armillaria ostoyae]
MSRGDKKSERALPPGNPITRIPVKYSRPYHRKIQQFNHLTVTSAWCSALPYRRRMSLVSAVLLIMLF